VNALALVLAAGIAFVPADSIPKGKALLARGRYLDAAHHYRELVSQYPGWVDAHLGLGYSLERLGRYKEAMASYEQALRLDARDVRALNNLAFLLVEHSGDVPRAIRLLGVAVKLRPDFSAAWDNLGWAHFRSRDYGAAQKAFQAALARNARYAPAHYHMGMVHLRREDYARARERFEHAVTLDPSQAKGWLALGIVEKKLDQRDRAYRALSKARSLVDRRSGLAREVTRLITGLGPVYGSGAAADRLTLLDRYAMPTSPPTSQNAIGSRTAFAAAPDRWQATGATAPAETGAIVLRRSAQSRSRLGVGGPELSRFASELPAGAPAAAGGTHAATGAQAPSRPGADVITVTEGLVKRDLVETHLRLARLFDARGLPGEALSEAQTVVNLAPFATEASEAREIITRTEGPKEAGLTRFKVE
jgi:tetratricopeptide (TPR) repeat protein